MRTLYHYPLCPYSRKIRLILTEKKLDFTLELEKFWEKRVDFLAMNAAGEVPVLVDLNNSILSDSIAIAEYLEEAYPERPLIPQGVLQRAEIRRLMAWFDHRIGNEITKLLLREKIVKRYLGNSSSSGPDSQVLRQVKNYLYQHLDYMSWLIDRRNWLGGEDFSLADITAAAHLSVIDYLGDIPWQSYASVKEWYMRIKSRPSFRDILQDRIPGGAPPSHYADLDF